MPTSTAWRRRLESTPRRGSSPERPKADSIERLSPEPVPTTPTRPQNASSRKQKEKAGLALQGLGLSGTPLSDRSIADPDHLYLDSHGRAHLGAKGRSPKRPADGEHTTARKSSVKSSTTQYRGPPKRGHTRTGSTIDDLANIAIATSPQFASSNAAFTFGRSPILHSASRPSTSYHNGYSQDSFDRPAKRIKSESMYAQEWSQPEERPRSSYSCQTEVRQEDAELLLGLQNGFKFNGFAPVPPAPQKLSSPTDASKPSKLEPAFERTTANRDDSVMADDLPNEPTATGDFSTHEPRLPHATPADTHPIPASADYHMADGAEGKPEEDARESADGKQGTLAIDENEQKPPPIQAATGTAEQEIGNGPLPDLAKKNRRVPVQSTQPVCPACNQMQYNGREGEATIDWIKCEGSCNRWFHIPCAGFTDHEVKKVAKFVCTDCEPTHGKTTYARTSTRARAAPDYAALNEGVMRSSEDSSMHHFVPKFKDGTIKYLQDDFARIRPEVLTQEFWENMDGMKRPIVVPACWNPRFGEEMARALPPDNQEEEEKAYVTFTSEGDELAQSKEEPGPDTALQTIGEDQVDVDQDFLEMVMPRDLTVRKVAELYGPDEPVPVIEVKTQETKGKYTLRQWANYYEETGSKPIRNVISLEVSHSRLGRLIRRPKVVRDIDLEPQVWDPQSRAASKSRPIAFYCLMSVGDSYTDFHIDFGGSSVYYHILKGMKTFFFIPPEDKYLKKYEDWNNSPSQNETWLPDLCDGNVTRVDLRPGDTAFIPAGWIHSVWTPEDSLVIGGNFLTRYDLDTQIKVAQIEKATNVSPAFKYPFFQKVMWYTMIKYLDDDPVPESVIREFQDDPEYRYLRALPIWAERDVEHSIEQEPDEAEYNARNYSKSELRGLPGLRDYIYRTARVAADLPVDNITKKQIDAVKASVPKGHGDPLQMICLFAVWVAWKTGNVTVPDWVHSDTVQHELEKRDKDKAKKAEVFRVPPERVSARRKNQASPAPPFLDRQESPETRDSSSPDASKLLYPRIACSHCRKKRQKCEHLPGNRVEESAKETLEKTRSYPNVTIDIAKLARASPVVNSIEGPAPASQPSQPVAAPAPPPAPESEDSSSDTAMQSDLAQAALARLHSQPPEQNGAQLNGITPTPGSAKKGRSKACEECRKSKRRCVHDEHGRVDPAKAAEPSKPRGSSSGKRPARISDEHSAKRFKSETSGEHDFAPVFMPQPDIDAMIDPALMGPVDPMLGLQYPDSSVPISDVNTFNTPPHTLPTANSYGMHVPQIQQAIDPNLDPALMAQAALDPILSGQEPTNDQQQDTQAPSLAQLKIAGMRTPDVDTSFSPITVGSGDVTSKNDSEDQQSLSVQDISMPKTSAPEEVQPQINGITHHPPAPIESAETDVMQEERRRSSAATGMSPKPATASPASRRSSSHTSGTIHQQSAAQDPDDTVTVNMSPKQTTPAKQHSSPMMKNEGVATSPSRARRDSNTADCEPDDPSEKLAKELQAQEHGLRRRPSVRTN